MSQWRVVDLVDFTGDVTTKRGRLMVGDDEVPLAEVSCVLLGNRARITSSVLHVTAKRNVALMVCDWRGVPVAASVGWSQNSRVAARHRAQAAISEPRRKNAWMRIVQAKIQGQASNLERKDSFHARRIRDLSKRVRSGDPDNCEAQAARMYWSRMFDNPGFSRSPGDGEGPNVLLDYGYGVLRAQVIRAVTAAGLIAALGLYHRNRSNAYALADDLIEPFRPVVDWIVCELEPDAWLTDPGVKPAIVGTLSKRFGPDARTVQSEIVHLAQMFGQYIEGETDRLTVHAWDVAGG